MNIQTIAGFNKEFLAYFKTKKFLTIALVILGLSILSPLIVSGLGFLMDAMSDIYDELGMDVSEMTDMLGTSASIGVSSSVGDITGTAIIVVLILLNSAAGGEQKKRSIIIPKSAGLNSFAHIFPKFIIYPLSIFFLSIAALFASWGVSVFLFDVNDVTFVGVLLAGILSGACLMFYTCFHLALGTATGQAGMSAAVCISASVIFSNIFAFVDIGYMFNPFALNVLAVSSVNKAYVTGSELLDIGITLAFALGIMVVSYFIALFAQNARKIDNSGNEIEL